MRIRTKLTLLLFMFILVVGGTISLLITRLAQKALRGAIGDSYRSFAEGKAHAVDLVLANAVSTASVLASSERLVAALKQANTAYAGKSLAEIQNMLSAADGPWIKSKETSPVASRILNSELSSFLVRHQQMEPARYGEIFLTDRYGAAVAMTKILSDYSQADEQWWSAAYGGGKGDVFLDDRGFDESVQTYVVGVVVPVREEGEVLGILKINFKIQEIMDLMDEEDTENGAYYFMLRSQGDFVAISKGCGRGTVSEEELAVLSSADPGYKRDRHASVNTLMGFAPVKARIHTRVPVPEAIKGVSGEEWEPTTWNFFIEADEAAVFGSVTHFNSMALFVLTCFIVLGAIAAFLLARSICAPIQKLKQGTDIVGGGDFDIQIEVTSHDEIGGLTEAFNQMTKDLRSVTASRDDLNAEVVVRQRVEAELRESESRLQAAQKISRIGNWELDLETGMFTFSKEMRRLCERDPAAGPCPVAEAMELFHEEDVATIRQYIQHASETGKGWEHEHRAYLPSDRDAWFHCIGKAVKDELGKVVRLQGTFQDITERKRAEKELYFRSVLLDSTQDSIQVLDQDGTIVYVNKAAARSTGYSKEELVGQNVGLLNPPEDAALVPSRSKEIIDRGQLSFEVIHVRKNGSCFPVEVVAHALEMEGRKVLVTVERDITERKKAEIQLRQSQKLTAIGTLARGMGHEINNPIMGIMNYAQLILDHLGKDSPVSEYAAEIGVESARVAAIVRRVLEFAEQKDDHSSPARPADLVQAALALLQDSLSKANIAVEIDVPEDLPQIHCRSNQLRQVLIDLLTNAWETLNEKYPESDEDKIVHITAGLGSSLVALAKDGTQNLELGTSLSRIYLTVEDHGGGISPEVRELIFDPFFSTKDRTKHSGLGLSTSLGIVKDHGGELTVESEVGRWTRFHVDLSACGSAVGTDAAGGSASDRELTGNGGVCR